jgi:hypothetical protein
MTTDTAQHDLFITLVTTVKKDTCSTPEINLILIRTTSTNAQIVDLKPILSKHIQQSNRKEVNHLNLEQSEIEFLRHILYQKLAEYKSELNEYAEKKVIELLYKLDREAGDS